MPEDEKPEKYPETYDAARGVGILSGKPPNEAALGPLRQPPAYYIGEKYKGRSIQNRDVERYSNGAVPGKRDKGARRLIRKAMKRRYAKTEQAPQLARDMQAQAREVAKEEGKSTRWARRLYEKELTIHQPKYVPTKKEMRKMRAEKRRQQRAEKRRQQRAGKTGDVIVDAISQLVDAEAKKNP